MDDLKVRFYLYEFWKKFSFTQVCFQNNKNCVFAVIYVNHINSEISIFVKHFCIANHFQMYKI